MDKTKNGLLELFAKISAVLAFFGLLTSFILMLLNLGQNQQEVRAISLASYIVYALATLWLVFKGVTIPPRLRWGILGAYYIVTILFFTWVGTWIKPPVINKWPPNLVTYHDFETDSGLGEWQGDVQRSTDHAFGGQYALKAIQPVRAEQNTGIELFWEHEIVADVIVGQVYWPTNEEVDIVWAQACAISPNDEWRCVGVPKDRGGWGTFVMDLSEMAVGSPPRGLDQIKLKGIQFQGELRGAKGTDVITMPMYVDSIQIFRDGRE
jgi:hypothetical protein